MKIFLTILLALICTYSLKAQFDIEAYKEYLSTHKDMSFDELIKEYPAGNFLKEAPTDFLKSYYSDSIKTTYGLTDFEVSLINKHGFMVTERYQYPSFLFAFWNIYNNDLPIYISSDAILHALHFSFDGILKRFESEDLNDLLIEAINKMKLEIPNLEKDSNVELYKQALLDLDLYLTVTQYLLAVSDNLYYKENQDDYDLIKEMINLKLPSEVKLLCNQKRLIDFSQFQVRGHYAGHKELQRYFQAMTWLGRTEILLSKPKNAVGLNFSDEDIQRMTILAALINEVANNSGAIENLKTIDQILTYLLGEQDNIKINEIDNIMKEMDLKASDLTDVNQLKIFSEKVLKLKSAQQLYNSQILFSGGKEQIVLPSVFLLLGQRPIIDAYIASNVVYDKILYNGYKIRRMIPSTSDLLFALGNDASIQLLESELKKFNYSSNLASLRYLIDGYDDKFWQSTTYTNWLNSIRSLNPPKKIERLSLNLCRLLHGGRKQ